MRAEPTIGFAAETRGFRVAALDRFVAIAPRNDEVFSRRIFVCARVMSQSKQKLASEPDLRQIRPVVVSGFIAIGSCSRHCERSEAIQGRLLRTLSPAALDCFVASLLAMTKEKERKKEAERRKTLFRNHRSLRAAARTLRGAHDFRRSTAALSKGSRRP